MSRVAVIGAGPSGLSAALWLKNLGLQPVVIEKAANTGGMQNFNILDNDWVLGQQGSTGVGVAQVYHQHVEAHDIPLCLSTQVVAIESLDAGFFLQLDGVDDISVDAVILATGTRYVGHEIFADVEGFDNIKADNIVDGPYAFFDLDQLGDISAHDEPIHIAIMGAGDNAFENALMLLERGCRVSIIARTTPKAQKKFTDAVSRNTLFSLYEQAAITRFQQHGDGLYIDVENEAVHPLLIKRLHVLAGYQPNNDINDLFRQGLGQSLVCDAAGFLVIDELGRTNIKGVYAAGDNSNPHFPSVVSAVASGALAAKTISRDFS